MIAFNSSRLSPRHQIDMPGLDIAAARRARGLDRDVAQQRRIDRLVEEPAHRPARRDGVGNVHAHVTLAEPRNALQEAAAVQS